MQSARRSPSVNLLLVSESPAWRQAVGGALAEIGGPAGLAACRARCAVVRLASAHERYSHLLLQPGSAEGLLDELVDLAAPAAGSGTEVILLGSEARHPRLAHVPAAAQPLLVAALNTQNTARSGPEISLAELEQALATARIEARYQPIVRVADRKPVAMEALARLNHPEYGPLAPPAFVPQMENAGLAARLTERVTSLALAGFAGPHLGGRRLQLTLNMPLDVVLSEAALVRLEEQRQAAAVAAEDVVIELTESRPVEDLALLARAVERLRCAGYGVSIDDIGPAVRNWMALLALPFTAAKLDKDLVQASATDNEARGFIQRTIAAATRAGLLIVAEGVETTALWRHVQALGVDLAQGFLIARPLPVAAVPVWLETWAEQAPQSMAV